MPKPVRDRFGLSAGARLELAESNDEIRLRPVRHQPSLVLRNGILVHQGRLPKGANWDRLLEDAREERLRGVTGR